jgi:outer membrane lipoprotein carrier protein
VIHRPEPGSLIGDPASGLFAPLHVSARGCVKSNVNRFCPLVCLLSVSAFAGDAQLGVLLKTVEQRYNRATTLQVLFREDYTRAGHARRSESGVLELRKPGRMRWEYSDPKGKLAVCDGKLLWLYNPAENRVEKFPLRDSDDLRAPLAFLLGKLHFEQEFRNLQGKAEGDGTRITAEPKNDSLPYSAVEFLVTAQGQIREVKVTQFDHSVMAYTFNQEKMNPPLADTLFRFQAPQGAEVVEANK